MTDWFQHLTGFVERDYDEVRHLLYVQDERLHSHVNGASYAIGRFEFAALNELRELVPSIEIAEAQAPIRLVSGDVRELHRRRANQGAVFQVASQFNLLEMVNPSMTPEDGVTRYAFDPTQGPACAIAAGAATIFRNYFVSVGNQIGQTRTRQLDGLAEVGTALSKLTSRPVSELWRMENGYALATEEGLADVADALAACTFEEREQIKGLLRVGVHFGAEVTDRPENIGQTVSQVFCSALPLGYSDVAANAWAPLARLVLEAAYEATLLCTVLNAARGGSGLVYLTLLGAGAFGNPQQWVIDALRVAIQRVRHPALDVRIVSRRAPSAALGELVC